MKAPKCKLCGADHWPREPHQFQPAKGGDAPEIPPRARSSKPVTKCLITDVPVEVTLPPKRPKSNPNAVAGAEAVARLAELKAKHAARMKRYRAKKREAEK